MTKNYVSLIRLITAESYFLGSKFYEQLICESCFEFGIIYSLKLMC